MLTETKNKALETAEVKTEAPKPEPLGDDGLPKNKRGYIQRRGWVYEPDKAPCEKEKPWRDPTTSGIWAWYYTEQAAFELQCRRDGYLKD